ncbi:hypothetical protein [Nitratireductor sp. GCM10026969]|uniref:hypothetical protein n=1 Tax=Nitratireductor sp. GCM10026969 TaxID=3252645 RepID=UPI0036201950
MSELVFASKTMQEVIAPPGAAPSISARIREAARKLRWTYWRAHSVWYADPRVSIKPRELRKIEEISGVRYGQEEAEEIDQLIARADEFLARRDPHPDSALAAALRAFIGALDRAGNQEGKAGR